MADFSQIIQEINTNLPDNNTQAITAAKLRDTLVDLTNTIDTVQDDFESDVNESIDEISNSVSSKQDANVTVYNYTPISYSGTYNGWISSTGFKTGTNLYVRIFPVTQGSTYKIKGGFSSGASSYMYAYFNGDTFIQAYDSAVGQTSTTKEYEITVPTEGTITHIAIQGGNSNRAACSLKEFSETINITNQVVANRDDVAELEVKLEGVTATETKVTQHPVTGGYVKGADGSIVSSSGTAYLEIALGETKRVRFLGGWYTSSAYTNGYAFGHYSDQSTWVTDKSSVFDTDASTLGTKEYIVAVPEGATHFRTTTATSSVPALEQNFYCYLQSGERVVDIIEELEDQIYETVEYPQTWVNNKVLSSPVVGQAPNFVSNSSYRYCYIEGLKSGDVVNAHFRAGSSYRYGAKLKNGVIVATVVQDMTTLDRTYVVDDTFDAIILNNYNGYVSEPTAKVITTESSIAVIKSDITDLQETVNDIIEQGVGGEFNLLCFGNSFTQDTISYIPWLIKECEPKLKLNVYFTYMGGMPISQCLAYISNGTTIALDGSGNPTTKYENHGGWDRIYSYSNGEWVEPDPTATNYHKSYTLYKYNDGANGWVSQSEPTAASVLAMKNWDLITIQQGGSINYRTWEYYFKPYVYQIQAELQKQVKHNFTLGYLMTHASYASTSETLLEHYNGIVQNTTKMLENTPVEIVMPYATALQNARTTYLDRFGAGGHLMGDTAHVSDGVGCLTCAYANTMAILDLIGSKKSIVGSQIYPDAAWLSSHNIPAVSSTIEGLSRYNIWLAQQCAVMATKYPLQLTDMVAKGMCGDTEIEIVNDAVYSSNPILSVNSGSEWKTILIAPDGTTISSVTVVMGSTDITSSVYDSSTHILNIPNVSAKVTITATTV